MTDDRWEEIDSLLDEKNCCISAASASLDLENNIESLEKISKETGISVQELLEYLQDAEEATEEHDREIDDVHPHHREELS